MEDTRLKVNLTRQEYPTFPLSNLPSVTTTAIGIGDRWQKKKKRKTLVSFPISNFNYCLINSEISLHFIVLANIHRIPRSRIWLNYTGHTKLSYQKQYLSLRELPDCIAIQHKKILTTLDQVCIKIDTLYPNVRSKLTAN